ncbi:hypothetical protein NS383_17715 [Pseudomonas oryzihabitans]|nr:hypothetical protein NS383_17715 [Pseudomonas psychrotolerans]
MLFSVARGCGFSSVLFGLKSSISAPFSTSVIISNYPEQWRSTYDTHAFHEVDPVVHHCLSSSISLLWTEDNFRTKAERKLYEEAHSHGVRSGLCIPIHGPRGEFGMLNFLCDRRSPDSVVSENGLAFFSLLRDYAVESFTKLQGHDENEPEVLPKLTARELECLKWVAAGKTSWEISRILSCAEVTVNYHVTNLMRKFNADTRQHAVMRGIRSGLVMP